MTCEIRLAVMGCGVCLVPHAAHAARGYDELVESCTTHRVNERPIPGEF